MSSLFMCSCVSVRVHDLPVCKASTSKSRHIIFPNSPGREPVADANGVDKIRVEVRWRRANITSGCARNDCLHFIRILHLVTRWVTARVHVGVSVLSRCSETLCSMYSAIKYWEQHSRYVCARACFYVCSSVGNVYVTRSSSFSVCDHNHSDTR